MSEGELHKGKIYTMFRVYVIIIFLPQLDDQNLKKLREHVAVSKHEAHNCHHLGFVLMNSPLVEDADGCGDRRTS